MSTVHKDFKMKNTYFNYNYKNMYIFKYEIERKLYQNNIIFYFPLVVYRNKH